MYAMSLSSVRGTTLTSDRDISKPQASVSLASPSPDPRPNTRSEATLRAEMAIEDVRDCIEQLPHDRRRIFTSRLWKLPERERGLEAY